MAATAYWRVERDVGGEAAEPTRGEVEPECLFRVLAALEQVEDTVSQPSDLMDQFGDGPADVLQGQPHDVGFQLLQQDAVDVGGAGESDEQGRLGGVGRYSRDQFG
ncbi:hypothetical protein GXW82_35570 [Streptacidiphilus sp. 4-A2]|nr:hypothetical protein [Streptacidiphilus sp. 4-A2]